LGFVELVDGVGVVGLRVLLVVARREGARVVGIDLAVVDVALAAGAVLLVRLIEHVDVLRPVRLVGLRCLVDVAAADLARRDLAVLRPRRRREREQHEQGQNDPHGVTSHAINGRPRGMLEGPS
jgi:hypothetical protein